MCTVTLTFDLGQHKVIHKISHGHILFLCNIKWLALAILEWEVVVMKWYFYLKVGHCDLISAKWFWYFMLCLQHTYSTIKQSTWDAHEEQVFGHFWKSAPVTLKIGQGNPVSNSNRPFMRDTCLSNYIGIQSILKILRVFTTHVDPMCTVTLTFDLGQYKVTHKISHGHILFLYNIKWLALAILEWEAFQL